MAFLFGNARFLSFGLFLAFMSSFGQTYFFGVFREPISAEFGLSNSAFGLLYMVVTLGSAVGLGFLGSLVDRVPLRQYAMALIMLLGVACLLLGLSGPLYTVLLAMMVVRLMGQGMMVHASMTSMSRYFDSNRGKAVAIAALGMPIGQAILPPLAVFMLGKADWQTVWTVFALAGPLVGVPLVWWLLRGHETRHAEWLTSQHRPTSGTSAEKNYRRRDVLGDYRFYLLLPAVLVVPFWITAVFFFAEDIAHAKGWTLQAFTGLYWMYAIGAGMVPLLAGALVDRVGGTRLIPWYPPVMALGLACVLIGGDGLAVGVFLMLMGVVLGLAGPVNNAMWAELYGTRHLGEIKALATSILLVSTALAPFLLGLLLDAGISLTAILTGGVVHSLVGALLALPVARSHT